MASVVRPHSTPASSASASPCSIEDELWPRLSLKATTTPPKAIASPTHCTPRSRSAGTKRGSSSATTKGEV